ncbi:hypothetical protein E4T56_gene3217 [Termitomyces sp. T112]|nr:hypothetical protein E4T56_gene3217 [Termitomyces sp. T112]
MSGARERFGKVTQPHFIQLGPQYSTQCFIPDPTSLCSILLNAPSQTQPRFVLFYSMLHPRPNLTLFYSTQCSIPDPTSLHSVRSSIFYSMLSPTSNSLCSILLNAPSQTQPHFVWLGPSYSTQC